MIAGWGRTAVDGATSHILKKAIVNTMSMEKCIEESNYDEEDIATDNFCALQEGVDSCTVSVSFLSVTSNMFDWS